MAKMPSEVVMHIRASWSVMVAQCVVAFVCGALGAFVGTLLAVWAQ